MTLQARAFIDLPPGEAIDRFRRDAQSAGLRAGDTAEGLLLTLSRGTVLVGAAGDRTSVLLSSGERVDMQLVRDLVAERTARMGLRLDWENKSAGGRPANLSIARVAEAYRLTPSYARIVLEGPDLGRFGSGGPHVRLLFGPPGADWPDTDEGGATLWPGGPEAWHRPVYTARRVEALADGGAGRIEMDVFLHAGGRATAWARTVAAGAEIALVGPVGNERPAAGWLGLVGDETALPVIARMLEGAPADTTGSATIFITDSGDAQELPRPAGMTLNWRTRGGTGGPLDALHALTLPEQDRFIFFAGEQSEAKAARGYLAGTGLAKAEFLSAGYWTRG